MNGLAQALHEVLDGEAAALVAAYFNPANRFAGSTFDNLAPNPCDHFAPSDLLAVSLLDEPLLPRAVRSILQDRFHEFAELLDAVPSGLDLWDASDEQIGPGSPAWLLWDRLRDLDGVGPTRTSKLMARKRPRLIPIVDGVVREHLPVGDDSWQSFREALEDPGLRGEIQAVRPPWLPSSVSTLRVLDAAIWMRYSKSKHVVPFRESR
jgi:hypothetical protein